MGRLSSRNAVVVGVASELGSAIARRFAAEGAQVLACDPSAEMADAVQRRIAAEGNACTTMAADFGNAQVMERVAQKCHEAWDHVDILMICAASLDWWLPDRDTMEDWESVFRVNVLTPIFYTRTFRKLLAASASASVIFYGSIDGIRGNPNLPAYSTSRAALVVATHVLAHTLGPDGTRVNCIAGANIAPLAPDAPGPAGATNDPLVQMAATPLGRRATVEDMAGTAMFLASDDSRYITGSVLVADGGRTAITPGTGLAGQ